MNNIIEGVDYGPLAMLIGKWVGIRGLDIAPDANAEPDRTEFIDEITFSVSGPAENAEEQQLVSVRYHHIVRKKENGLIFHDQIGHWIYEKETGLLMHSLTIPRGICVLAGGKVTEIDGENIFEVEAKAGSDTFGIVQSPFMLEKAKTNGFKMKLRIKDWAMSYKETTSLFIYGKAFEHIDKSKLTKVAYDLP